jgi:hypothetical protein
MAACVPRSRARTGALRDLGFLGWAFLILWTITLLLPVWIELVYGWWFLANVGDTSHAVYAAVACGLAYVGLACSGAAFLVGRLARNRRGSGLLRGVALAVLLLTIGLMAAMFVDLDEGLVENYGVGARTRLFRD